MKKFKVITKKIVIDTNHYEDKYLTMTDKQFEDLIKIEDIYVVSTYYQNNVDKLNNKVKKYSIRKVTDFKKLSFRDSKRKTYRYKISGNLEIYKNVELDYSDSLTEELIYVENDIECCIKDIFRIKESGVKTLKECENFYFDMFEELEEFKNIEELIKELEELEEFNGNKYTELKKLEHFFIKCQYFNIKVDTDIVFEEE